MPLIWIGIYLTIGGLVLLAPSRRPGGAAHKHSRNALIVRTLTLGLSSRTRANSVPAGAPFRP